MQVRTKLTLIFTIISALILVIFACVIYYVARENREKEFYTLLKKEAYTKANLFLDAHVDKKTLQEIYSNNRQILNEVEVALYDTDYNLLYHDAVEIDFVKETPEMLQEINHKTNVGFYQDRWQVVGVLYEYRQKNYLITAAGYDQYGYNKQQNLLHSIIVAWSIAVIFIYFAGRLFSKKVFEPIIEMTKRARNISAHNLDLRVSSRNNNDELSQLANTFNEMLNRLENSFDAQKHFVSNISHEIRTPLSAIIAELELSSNKERSILEYKSVINNALSDAKKLGRLSNSLLDFAKASYDPAEISFKTIRIDEVLLDALQQVQKLSHAYKLNIHFDTDFEEDMQISVHGNEYLLKIAFINLFENGCKFSKDKKCTVAISSDQKNIILKFRDEGVGIAEPDLQHIFTPFFRGQNETFAEGNGIGLPLTQKIIRLHSGDISVTSALERGTTFTISLPHRNTF